jgi:4-hydroxy-3-methylbut-2-enyl diphosphate reductase IspH
VQTDGDVCAEWLDGANVVGLTAGTSTPDEVIDRVESRIRVCADTLAGQGDRSAV